MPIFALANAGVIFSMDRLAESASSRIALGILLGLFIGKPLGLVGFSWLAIRLGIAQMPAIVSWRHMFGLGLIAGVGFTMSIFISGLAFHNEEMNALAKIGIFAASIISGVAGYLYLRAKLYSDEINADLTQQS